MSAPTAVKALVGTFLTLLTQIHSFLYQDFEPEKRSICLPLDPEIKLNRSNISEL